MALVLIPLFLQSWKYFTTSNSVDTCEHTTACELQSKPKRPSSIQMGSFVVTCSHGTCSLHVLHVFHNVLNLRLYSVQGFAIQKLPSFLQGTVVTMQGSRLDPSLHAELQIIDHIRLCW